MEFVQSIMSLRAWRVADWATAVKRQGWLDELWETKELWELKMHWARELFGMLMGQHWGVSLGLYLTLTEHMPTRQIRRISQASSRVYQPSTNSYAPKVLLYNPHKPSDMLHVPSIFPPLSKFLPEIQSLTAQHGLEMSPSGRIAFQSLQDVAAESARETARLAGLPLSAFSTSDRKVCLAIQLDAARRRTRQFVACVAKNPQLDSQSCFALRLLALGVRFKDDRYGAQQLLARNLEFIEVLLNKHVVLIHPGGDSAQAPVPVYFSLYFVGDFAGVRAIEGSICGCNAEASHDVPSAESLSSLEKLKAVVRRCDCRTSSRQRTIRAHEPLDGQVFPCDCCSFGHALGRQKAELAAFQSELKALQDNATTEKGKQARSAFNSSYKRKHKGTLPGPDSRPFTSANLERWVVDLLHVDLNEGKLTWKWALLRRLPADTRSKISVYLKGLGLALDLRTKEEGRQAMDKFYDGGEWQRLVCGGGKSPGGAVVVATMIKYVADYYKELEHSRKTLLPPITAPAAGCQARAPSSSSRPTKSAMRGGTVTYGGKKQTSKTTAAAATPEEEDVPWREAFDLARSEDRTEAEELADQPSLQKIRLHYGETAERLIAMLLTFDAYFSFREVMGRRLENLDDIEECQQHVLLFARTHRAYWEQLERVSLGRHKSQYPHVVQYKAVAQLLQLKDLWNFSLSALESYHAEVGRVADRTGCKRIDADVGEQRTHSTAPLHSSKEGPTRRVAYQASSTMASSVAKRLVAARTLNESEDLRIDMRAQSRLLLAPEAGGGRVTNIRTAPKLSGLQIDPDATAISVFAALI